MTTKKRSAKRTDFGRLLPSWNGKHPVYRAAWLMGYSASEWRDRMAAMVLHNAFVGFKRPA